MLEISFVSPCLDRGNKSSDSDNNVTLWGTGVTYGWEQLAQIRELGTIQTQSVKYLKNEKHRDCGRESGTIVGWHEVGYQRGFHNQSSHTP